EPALASLLGGIFLLLTTVAVLGFSLQQQGKTRLEQAAQGKVKQLEALLDRIEAEWDKAGRELLHIPSRELEVLTDHPLRHDPSEVRVTLGLRAKPSKPDVAVYQIAPLAI